MFRKPGRTRSQRSSSCGSATTGISSTSSRTRTRAQELVASGHVRIDGVRTRDPARAVKIGDVLTVAMEGRTMVVRVVGLPDGRGSYEIARLAYEELAEPKR